MRAPLSIVIPTLNSEQVLPGCLRSLIEGISAELVRELIVSDGGSTDATLSIADAAGAKLLCGPASRGGQLRRGAQAASGDWMLFLHADTRLSDRWSDAVADHIAKSDQAAAFRLRFRAKGTAPRVVAGWANLRSRLGLPYGDQGLLIRCDLYERLGGYADIPLMEDVDLVRRLKGRVRLLAPLASTSAERYQSEGWIRRGTRNLWTLGSYFGGVPPEHLAMHYTNRSRGPTSPPPC